MFCFSLLVKGQDSSENLRLKKDGYAYLYDAEADTVMLNRFLADCESPNFFALPGETIEEYFSRALELAKQLTEKSHHIRVLNKLSEYQLDTGEYETALTLANKVIRLATLHDVPDAFIDSNYRLSVIFRRRGDFFKAVNHIQKGLRKAKAINSNYWIVNGYGKMSAINERVNKRHLALENLLNAQKVAQELGDPAELAMIKIRIGRMYIELRERDKALQYRSTALELAEQSADSLMILTAKHRLGDCYRKMGQLDRALSLYEEVAEYRKKNAPRDRYGHALVSIGKVYYLRERYERALEYYERALPHFKAMHHNSMIFHVHTRMGQIYMQLDDISMARKVYQEASKYINNHKRRDFYANLYQQLSQLEAKEENYKEAYRYQKLHKVYYDSVQFDQQNKLSAYNEARFEFEMEKEKQKAAFNTQLSVKEQQIAYRNYLIAGFIVFSLVVIMLLILLYRSRGKQKEALAIIKEKNESLEELDKIKNNYFTILAHDLRTPFGTLLQLSEIAHQYSRDNNLSDFEEMTSLLEQSAYQFNDLLESTLEWGRLQMNGIRVNKERLNLADEVDRILSFVESSAQMKEIIIISTVPKGIEVYSDKDLLQAILNNLVSNAIKYTNNGGEITISTRIVDPDYVEVSVADNGVGISEEKLDTIFIPGKHMSRKGTDGETGTGFGLINSKKMVELNGGQLSIESTKGEGTVLRFTLQRIGNE